MIVNGQKKEENGYATSSGTRVTVGGHAGPRNSQTNVSAIIVTANGHSESASAPDGPGSGQKTVTGTAETAHRQKGSVTSHGESAFIHETANGPCIDSATRVPGHTTPETANGHRYALHENLDVPREMNVKSVSGNGPR